MSNVREVTLRITGMHCASCVSSVEQGLSSVDGISRCLVNLATHSASVTFDESQLNESGIIEKVQSLGYKAEVGQPDITEANKTEEAASTRAFLTSLVSLLPLMLFAMWPMIFGGYLVEPVIDAAAQALLAGIVLFYSGRGILADAGLQARHFRVNMNSLIAMGTLPAYGWSLYAAYLIYSGETETLYFETAGMIVALILLGRMLEARARRKAGSAIEELLKLRPSTATALINGVEIEIEPAAARMGMILLVRAGERVAADGVITEGLPVLDESVLTGESVPVEKKEGDSAIGGSLNGNIPFKMKVTTAGESSFLAMIIKLVSDAQSAKAPVQKLADRVAGVFVPGVLVAALLTGLAWYLLAPESPMLIRSVISVLIIACPCALGLATPTAVLAGSGRGAKEGIIIKGGDILEAISAVDTVVFDKTGTLTKGHLEVLAVKAYGGVSLQNLIRMVGSVESQSEHPVGQAIVKYMKNRQVSNAVVKNAETRPGFGMLAECDGQKLIIGNRALMELENIALGPALLQGEREMEQGRTVVFAAMAGQVIGMIALGDQIRGDARDLVAQLQRRDIRVTMLSGDNRRTAAGVARILGIEHYEAEIKPSQKQLMVESYRRAGLNVAVVGDGINDAPALAAANVGVALGSGTDVAIETADVVLVRSELSAVAKMFSLSTATMRIIRQNLFWAFFYNIIAIPVAAGLFYPAFHLTLSPMIAALAMSLSSVFVVTNSLRLNRLEL